MRVWAWDKSFGTLASWMKACSCSCGTCIPAIHGGHAGAYRDVFTAIPEGLSSPQTDRSHETRHTIIAFTASKRNPGRESFGTSSLCGKAPVHRFHAVGEEVFVGAGKMPATEKTAVGGKR